MGLGLAVVGAPLWGGSYSEKVLATRRANLIAYWPLWEAGGTVAADVSGNGRNGATTGATPGQPGIGDGRTAYSFDGINDVINVYSASLSGAFNGQSGSLLLWFNIAELGATIRTPLTFFVDGANYIQIYKSTADDLTITYVAGGTNVFYISAVLSALQWYSYALTWSLAADQVINYLNGAQVGATFTGLGTWAGSLSATRTVLANGNANGVDGPFYGSMAHTAVWTTPLAPSEIAALAKVAS